MKALRQQLALMAGTNGRVLIYGESGTGKELVAHALHAIEPARRRAVCRSELRRDSRRADRERAVRPSSRAASPARTKTKIGKFQKADGGTLFLDEVGDMSLRTQAKVLRALEEQRFEPVGAAESVQVDVRVVAATNKNLEEEIERGNFREDLFYRLNVIPFLVPPLRDRREDIPLLAEHFLREFTTAYGRKPKELTPEAYRMLAGLSLAGQRARAEQSDRAHRDSESAGARGRAPHSVERHAPRRRTADGSLRQPAGSARSRRARIYSEEAGRDERQCHRAGGVAWAWSAAICTAR